MLLPCFLCRLWAYQVKECLNFISSSPNTVPGMELTFIKCSRQSGVKNGFLSQSNLCHSLGSKYISCKILTELLILNLFYLVELVYEHKCVFF